MPFDPVLFAIPVFAIMVLAEIVWAQKSKKVGCYEKRDAIVSLSLGIGSLISGAASAGLVAAMLLWLHQFSPMQIGWSWWAWPLCFILDDLAYYVFHRSAHRIRWFWASHVNHHSSEHYNLTTALRQSWTSFLALSFIFRWPLALAGFEPGMILVCGAFNLIYQFWIHTEAVHRMPQWFEAIMNTPSHHRVHHAVNPRYLDRNYAGTFIVWDKLFGTFQSEMPDEAVRYGIVHPLGSFNLLVVVFHEWIAIIGDVWRAPWSHKLSYLWRLPGWSHDGSRDTSDAIRERWLSEQQVNGD